MSNDNHEQGGHGQGDEKRPIIIRRIKKIKKGGHHGGSWKIAYADFVTAMMAFFLLMWLLGLLNKYQLAGVSEYFSKPMKEAFKEDPHLRGVGKNTERFTEKEKEKYKEKEKEKEKNKEKETEKNKEKETDKGQGVQMKMVNPTPDKDQKTGNAEKPSYVMINPYQKILRTGSAKTAPITPQSIKADLERKMEKDPILRQFKNQLNFQVTADGLKIQLRDLENKSMFTKGKADFQNYSKAIISWLSQELNHYQNRIVIIGHTDAAPYVGENYSNWELSADRANATRRELVKNGLNQDKIVRVIGVSNTDLLDKKDGLNPSNRRIDIIVMTDDAIKKMSH